MFHRTGNLTLTNPTWHADMRNQHCWERLYSWHSTLSAEIGFPVRVCWKWLAAVWPPQPTPASQPVSSLLPSQPWFRGLAAHPASGSVQKCVWSWGMGFGRTLCEKWNVYFYFSLTFFFSLSFRVLFSSVCYRALYSFFKSANSVEMVKMWLDIF